MAIVVLGMHRSGTSMVTRLLHRCGLYLGQSDDLLHAESDRLNAHHLNDNPHGYWENIHFIDFNDDLLAVLGGDYLHPPPLEIGWESDQRLKPFLHRARGLLSTLDQQAHWGWKDPRNMLTAAFWQQVQPDLKLVFCIRDPSEVLRSILGRNFSTMTESVEWWLRYHETLLMTLDHSPYLVTHHQSYFYDPVAELQRVLEFCGLPIEDEMLKAAVATIDPNLYRNRDISARLEPATIPHRVWEYYQPFTQLAGPVYQRLQHDVEFQQRQYVEVLAQQQRRFTESETQQQIRIQELENVIQTMQGGQQWLESVNSELSQQVTQHRTQVEHAQVQIKQLEQQAATLQAAQSLTRDQLAEIDQERIATHERWIKLQAQHEALESVRDQLHQDAASLRAHYAELMEQLETANQQIEADTLERDQLTQQHTQEVGQLRQSQLETITSLQSTYQSQLKMLDDNLVEQFQAADLRYAALEYKHEQQVAAAQIQHQHERATLQNQLTSVRTEKQAEVNQYAELLVRTQLTSIRLHAAQSGQPSPHLALMTDPEMRITAIERPLTPELAPLRSAYHRWVPLVTRLWIRGLRLRMIGR
jgi:hypothetical protein